LRARFSKGKRVVVVRQQGHEGRSFEVWKKEESETQTRVSAIKEIR
jgi:hypothetical protein